MSAKGRRIYIGFWNRLFSHFSHIAKILAVSSVLIIIAWILISGGVCLEVKRATAEDPSISELGDFASCYAPYVIETVLRGVIGALIIFLTGLVIAVSLRERIVYVYENVMARQRGEGFWIKLIAGSPKMKREAERFDKEKNSDYVIFQKAAHTKQVYWIPFFTKFFRYSLIPKERKFESGLFHSLNDIIISRAAAAVNCEAMPWLGEGHWYGDAITDWECQKTAYHDGEDLPLRFVQATPNARFTDSQRDTEQTPKAKYLFFMCLTNPIRDVIQIVTLADVLERLKLRFPNTYTQIIHELSEPVFPIFYKVRVDRPDEDAFQAQHSERRPILQQDPQSECGYRSGFDVNKLDRATFNDLTPDQRKALQSFYEALNDVVADAEDIHLKSGDILMINNYYTFHRRKELMYRIVNWLTILPRRRWLRVYYTFPVFNSRDRHAKEEREKNRSFAARVMNRVGDFENV